MVTYSSLNAYLRKTYGEKLYKLALDAGCTCPNRDGAVGNAGCSFCLAGSGDFAEPVFPGKPRPYDGAGLTPEDYRTAVGSAVSRAEKRVRGKFAGKRYIAYFQSYTNTYGQPEHLRQLFLAAARDERIAVISVGTRPDCLGPEMLALLKEVNTLKPVWVELGLQTVHEATALQIRRGYGLPAYDRAVRELKAAGLYAVVHMIIGLPGETREMMRETAEYIGKSGADGIKLQLLHVLKGTELAKDWEAGKISLPTMDGYADIVEELISALPENVTVHRLTGDGPKKDLMAPLWSADKKRVLQALAQRVRPRES